MSGPESYFFLQWIGYSSKKKTLLSLAPKLEKAFQAWALILFLSWYNTLSCVGGMHNVVEYYRFMSFFAKYLFQMTRAKLVSLCNACLEAGIF